MEKHPMPMKKHMMPGMPPKKMGAGMPKKGNKSAPKRRKK